MRRRKSLSEIKPDVAALARRLRRRKPKGGQLSLRAISFELAAQGNLNERSRPFKPKSIASMPARKHAILASQKDQQNPMTWDTGTVTPVLGRSCGTCTLCCKVLGIAELQKPMGAWCPHCKQGTGCTIYQSRPTECRNFICGYLGWEQVPENWKPSKSRMVIVSEIEGTRLAIHVDPGRPNAWRENPFFQDLKSLAEQAAKDRNQVVVMIGMRAIMIFPDREVDLGIIADDELIVTGERSTSGGISLDAYKIKRTAEVGAGTARASGRSVSANAGELDALKPQKD